MRRGETVETLFRRFEQASPNAKKLKRKLVDQIVRELAVHAVIEEQDVAKWLLKELENLPPEAERLSAKVKVLMENVRTHVAEEERRLFPRVRKAFSPAELREMAQMLMMAKKAAPTRPHPRAPDSPPGNLVAGAVSAVLDMGKEAVRSVRRGIHKPKARKVTPSAPQQQGNGAAHGLEADASQLM
jgi:hypothetical protein